MDPAARVWLREYKKIFDEVSRLNAGNSAAEMLGNVVEKRDGTATKVPEKVVKRIGKIVDDSNSSPKTIKKIGKLVENAQKTPLTNINQEDMSVSGRSAIATSEKTKITAEMSDGERANVLRSRTLVAPIYEGQADGVIDSVKHNYEKAKKRFGKKAVVEIAEKLGIIGESINFDDIEVRIVLSKGNIEESITKEASPEQIAKLLPILSKTAKSAVVIERHNNRYYYDTDTIYFENLVGAYVDGNNVIPIRFGLKHSRTGSTALYVVVDQNKISKNSLLEAKKDRGHSDTSSDFTESESPLISVKYSIPQILSLVNSKDLLRYIPDDFLDSKQIDVKNKAIAETQEYTDRKNNEKYAQYVESGKTAAAKQMLSAKAKAEGYDADSGWRMNHQAPNSHDDTGHSLDQIDRCYGGDGSIYSKHAVYYYGEGRSYDAKAIRVIQSARNNPDAMIKIYRAVPPEVKDTRVRNGDWVAVVKEYAEEHGDRLLDGNYRIIENIVPAKHLWNNGDSINEFGYDNGNTSEVYQNTVNNVKTSEITYDDEGRLIPISKRYDSSNPDIRYALKTDADYKVKVDAKAEARADAKIEKAEARAEAKAEARVEKAKANAEARADKRIETEKAKMHAEYKTDKVFSQTTVNNALGGIEAFKALPSKVRNELARNVWLEMSESDGAEWRRANNTKRVDKL